MKKLLSVLFIITMLFTLAACNSDEGSTTETGSYEIEWQMLPDDEVVGAWKAVEPVADEYLLFTPESKLRIVEGTFITEADIKFGIDGSGNKSAYTQHNYLYGQWTYTVKDGVLTVTYPEYSEESDVPVSYDKKIFNAVDYSPITLEADEDFKADEKLVGKWTNATYSDAYEFTADGYVIYTQEVDDGVYLYDAEIKKTYTISNDKIVWTFYYDNSGEVTTEAIEYSIDGTKLVIDNNDYYLNGVGDPAFSDTEQ